MSQLFRHDISSGEFQLEISPFRKILRVSPQIDMRILVVGPYIKLCNSKGATQLKMTRDMVFEDDCHLGFTSILDSSFHFAPEVFQHFIDQLIRWISKQWL